MFWFSFLKTSVGSQQGGNPATAVARIQIYSCSINLTCTLIALSKSSCFLMRASTLSRESPLSSLLRKASRAAIQFSACSQSLLKSCKVYQNTLDNTEEEINADNVFFGGGGEMKTLPAIPNTDPASSYAVPRPSPSWHALDLVHPAFPLFQGWHNAHEPAAAVQIAQRPGRCQLWHQSLCGAPREWKKEIKSPQDANQKDRYSCKKQTTHS